jgi:hypothetical protein
MQRTQAEQTSTRLEARSSRPEAVCRPEAVPTVWGDAPTGHIIST